MIQVTDPAGIIPRLAADKLPDNAAQTAINCNFNNGGVRGLKVPATATTHSSTVAGMFVYSEQAGARAYLFGYDIDGAKGVGVNDAHKRFYWTGKNGSTKEFRFSKATQAVGYVGAPGTSYKVGVIDSTKWDNNLSSLGVSFEVRNKGVPAELGAIANPVARAWLTDEAGTRLKDITADVSMSPSGLSASYTFTLAHALSYYSEKTVSATTYTKKTRNVTLDKYPGATYTANLWYASGVLKYCELVSPIPAALPSGVTAGASIAITNITPGYWTGGDDSRWVEGTYEVIGALQAVTASTMSFDGSTVPGGLAGATGDTAITTTNPKLAIDWQFDYDGQHYSAWIQEGAPDPVHLDAAGGISLTLVRGSATSYTATLVFGTDMPLEERSYVCTWVNQLGEESEPSNPFAMLLNPGQQSAVIIVNPTTFTTKANEALMVADRYPIHGARFYRTASDSSGNTEFLYAFTLWADGGTVTLLGDNYTVQAAAVVAGANVEYADTVPASQLGSACGTQEYIYNTAELQDLQGLTAIHNGMLASFKGGEVWICEPYKPWAYRREAIYPLPVNVVRLIAVEQGFVALTEGQPYFFSGTLPESMTFQAITGGYACMNKRAATGIGGRVYYLSSDGPAFIDGMQVKLDPSFSRETWREAYPFNTAQLASYGNRLVAYLPVTGGTYIFDTEDSTWTTTATRIDCAVVVPTGAFGVTADQLAFAAGGATIYWFGGGAEDNWVWHSKDFMHPRPINYGALQLIGSGTAVAKVYCDGVLTFTSASLTLSAEGVVVRLPAGFKKSVWSVRIEGAAGSMLKSFALAVSPGELRGG